MNTETTGKVPAHLWAVGGLSLLWNAFGCYIYTITMMRDPAMMAQASEEMRAAIESTPMWANSAWALGVWGALIGSILLLMRNRLALHAYAVSLLGLIGTAIYEVTSGIPVNLPQIATIWAVALFLLWYAWSMTKTGVLR
ncbi:hypothetical protein [Erythrobacter mangrovi]|uniref:Uncharacterized protein n=1 Tax=Erythrobacter mangrovi TaxID=2739433 RepID=A0A7D3XH34_9SPHN|nr:hypothetical protein [Erythrobacter mangrovi]QKG70099.1 hypothetical protein HQR01_01210 [Erythrobacter mangrovi]